MRRTLLAVMLVATGGLAGCLDVMDAYYGFDPDAEYKNPGVFPGEYRFSNTGSIVLSPGNLTAGAPEVVRLVSDLPAYGGALAGTGEDEVEIVMAVWRPVDHEGPVPVIVDAGPYYEVFSRCVPTPQNCQQVVRDAIDHPGQTTPFNLLNFLPHGYAVVQLAVRGTGTAGGCMDLMGPSEVHDLDQAITWIGEQEWSNGAIAMVGASYDGSTPWEVAGTGNPHLKTIVPTSGLPDIYDLMFHNGSAETRGPIMHNQVYWGYGFDDDFPQRPEGWPEGAPWLPPAGIGQANGRTERQDRQNLLCAEVAEGSAVAAYSTVDGGRGSAASTYWTERDHRQAVLDNYEGSVFLVHGLQDWNVDPHAAIPFNQQLRDAGIRVKEWYGQWDHAFPDSRCAQSPPEWVVLPCRIDFADVLLRWFDQELKGQAVDTGPAIQVQDNIGFWRNADSYPPRDAAWQELRLGADGALSEEGAQAGEVELSPPMNGAPGTLLELRSEPLEEELHLSGMLQIKLPFETQGQGGHIAAWLFDEDPRGLVRAPFVAPFEDDSGVITWTPFGLPLIAHGQMNLRYHPGGDEPQPLVPGETYVAQIESEPLEVRVPAGHRLVLWLFQYHYPDHMDSSTPATVTLHLGDDARLLLPGLDVDPRTVFPVPGVHYLDRTYVPETYVSYPDLPASPMRVDEVAARSDVAGLCRLCEGFR